MHQSQNSDKKTRDERNNADIYWTENVQPKKRRKSADEKMYRRNLSDEIMSWKDTQWGVIPISVMCQLFQ